MLLLCLSYFKADELQEENKGIEVIVAGTQVTVSASAKTTKTATQHILGASRVNTYHVHVASVTVHWCMT